MRNIVGRRSATEKGGKRGSAVRASLCSWKFLGADLTPGPPSLRGKGEHTSPVFGKKAPLVSGRGRGRGPGKMHKSFVKIT